MVAYEQRLDADRSWALSEGSRHFEDRSAVQETLRGIAERLDGLKVPYAIVGGMALFQHGYRRFTEDVDVLVGRDGLRRAHEGLDGLGYVPTFAGSRGLRDTATGVRIDFLVAGEFPGDGAPKPVAFPDPDAADVVERHGVRYLGLAALINLKLASGMSSPGRLRDLADVMELIRSARLTDAFAAGLDDSVRVKFRELVAASATESGRG